MTSPPSPVPPFALVELVRPSVELGVQWRATASGESKTHWAVRIPA